MRSMTFLILLLATSAILFAPAIQADEEVELTPQQPSSILLLVRSTDIQLETEIESVVLVNVSFIDTAGDERTIQTNALLVETLLISAPETGTYQLTLLSEEFGIINIDQGGITQYQLIYYTVVVLAFFYMLYKNNRFF